MALLIVLGILAVVLILAVGFSSVSIANRLVAGARADAVRARLLAESGVERTLGMLRRGFANDVYPGDRFLRTDPAGPWGERQCLASMNGAEKDDIQRALCVAFGDRMFTPEAELHPAVGWLPMRSVQRVDGAEREVIIGRLGYLIIDESGKLDPNAVVSAGDESEDETPASGPGHVRTGASAAEIALADAGIVDADRLRPDAVAGGQAGLMPAACEWLSLEHVARTLDPAQPEMNRMASLLCPVSRDREVFWRDADADGQWDEGEDEDRMDLAGALTLEALYRLFVGPDPLSADDDCLWLKELDSSTWVQGWQTAASLTSAQVRRRLALQTAVNILDCADPDSDPAIAHLDAAGLAQPGLGAGQYNVTGVETTWGASAVAMRIDVMNGFMYVNATGQFDLQPTDLIAIYTPSGTITKQTLLDNGAGWEYNGPVIKIVSRTKNQDNTLAFDGQDPQMTTSEVYTIVPESMTIRLYNPQGSGGNASGQWIVKVVSSASVTVSPDHMNQGYRFRPSFKGQAFQPFPGAAPPQTPTHLLVNWRLAVRTVDAVPTAVNTETSSGVASAVLDISVAVDGGQLAYSSAYVNGGAWINISTDQDDAAHEPYIIAAADVKRLDLVVGDASNTLDTCPLDVSADLCSWSQGTGSTEDKAYFAYLQAHDPLLNDRAESDPDFPLFWQALPDATLLAVGEASDPSLIGGISVGYESAPYADVTLKNAAFERIGELGRVHSYQPMRSLRLWSATAADETGHDAGVLDLFKIGSAVRKRGKVNVNTLHADVLKALFARVTTVSATAAAAALVAKRDGGATFGYGAECFGSVAGLSGGDATADDAEEAAIVKLAELVTVRRNCFTVVVAAQAIKDVAGLKYDSDGNGTLDKTADYNVLDIGLDASGKQRRVDKIVAEQRILAVVYRDAHRNTVKIERLEYLE